MEAGILCGLKEVVALRNIRVGNVLVPLVQSCDSEVGEKRPRVGRHDARLPFVVEERKAGRLVRNEIPVARFRGSTGHESFAGRI